MKKDIKELNAKLQKEVNTKIDELKEGQIIIFEIKNDNIAQIYIGETWKNAAENFNLLSKMVKDGEPQVYSNRAQLEGKLKADKRQFVWYFDKYKEREKEDIQRVSKKDAKAYLLKSMRDVVNAIKGGKYTAQDIEDLKEGDKDIKAYNDLLKEIEKMENNGEYNAEYIEKQKAKKPLKEAFEKATSNIETLSGKDKPSNFTEDQVKELVDFVAKALPTLVELRSKKNNEALTSEEVNFLLEEEVKEEIKEGKAE